MDRAMYALLTGMEPRTVEVVKDLAARYPLYLLSNNNPISMKRCLAILRENGIDPETCFRGQFSSAEMKLMKPSAEFYREVIRRIGVEPEEILFVDDSPANVEGAREVGINARHFIPGSDLGLCLADC